MMQYMHTLEDGSGNRVCSPAERVIGMCVDANIHLPIEQFRAALVARFKFFPFSEIVEPDRFLGPRDIIIQIRDDGSLARIR